jgi:two-component system response regulator WspF
MRIAIVNDLAIARETLRRIILSVPDHEVAWTAYDGEEAVRKNAADSPDLILMDLIMPKMGGAEATRRIMTALPPCRPCPILIVTATVGKNAAKVFEAMGHGALDAVSLPMMGEGAEAQRSRYALLRKINIIERLRRASAAAPVPVYVRPEKMTAPVPPIVVIGASTGGPKALADIISALPEDFAAAVVIIQHVDEKFSASLVTWLDGQSALRVELAPPGRRPLANRIYVAGTNDHLILKPELTFSYSSEPADTPFRPSVDVFFKSTAAHWPVCEMRYEVRGQGYEVRAQRSEVRGAAPDPGPRTPNPAIAVLLTGMGRDGAEGLSALRRAGWHTIAQDEASSVVYGMPKAAKELGAAVEILDIRDIGPAIVRRLNGRSAPTRARDWVRDAG